MKRFLSLESALIVISGLLALAAVWHSATGGDRVSLVLLAVFLSAAAMITGPIVIRLHHRAQRMRPALIVPILALAIIISVAVTEWPLRASYAWSRNSLDAIATRVRSGEGIATPLRAGLFKIRGAEISRSGIVCLWTHPHSGGSTGFVQTRADSMPFNLWSMVGLDERWQFISED
jgi:hypothetical protein